jgi:leucyl aminopeptidase
VINDKYRDKNEFNTMVESICLTRDFVNEPANELNPDTYSHKIEDLFKKNNKINIDIIK